VWFAHVARGIAALMVLYARFIFEFQEQKDLVSFFAFTEPIHVPTSFLFDVYKWPAERFSIDPGAVAVGLFFMLSGFVIPFALERRTLPAFGIRRVLRVYPTLAVATGLSIFLVWLNTRGEAFPYERPRIVGGLTLLSQYQGEHWIDPSYWTIPIEELFYITAAGLAAFRLLRRPTVLVLTAAAVSGLSLWAGRVLPPTLAAGETPDWTFWTRFWLGRNLGFMTFVWVGVALHMLYRGFWSRRTFAIVAILISGIFYFSLHHGPFQPPYLPGDQATGYFNSFIAGLVAFLILYWVGDRLPKNRPLQVLGDISYPVYLVGTVIGWAVLVAMTNSLGSYFWALPVTTVIVLVLAYALHKVVEDPAMNLARRITGRPRYRTARSWSDPPRRWRRRVEATEPVTEPVTEPAVAARTGR